MPTMGGAGGSQVSLSHRKIVSGTSLSWGLEAHLLLLWFHHVWCQRSPWPFTYHLLLSRIGGVQHNGNGMTWRNMQISGSSVLIQEKSGNWVHPLFNVAGN